MGIYYKDQIHTVLLKESKSESSQIIYNKQTLVRGMSKRYPLMAKKVLDAFKKAGVAGLTLKEVSKKIDEEGCGHDCENWIETFVEAGILILVEKEGKLNRYFITEKGLEALG